MSGDRVYGESDRRVFCNFSSQNVEFQITNHETHPLFFDAINTYLLDKPYDSQEILAEFAAKEWLRLDPINVRKSAPFDMMNITVKDDLFLEDPISKSTGRIIRSKYDAIIKRKAKFGGWEYVEVKHNHNMMFHISTHELEHAYANWPNYLVLKIKIHNHQCTEVMVVRFKSKQFIRSVINY